jgi:hypothetical protein
VRRDRPTGIHGRAFRHLRSFGPWSTLWPPQGPRRHATADGARADGTVGLLTMLTDPVHFREGAGERNSWTQEYAASHLPQTDTSTPRASARAYNFRLLTDAC